jgi:transposase
MNEDHSCCSSLLKIEKIAIYPGEVRLAAKARPMKSARPSCGRQSDNVHSRYRRLLADLPWEGITARLILSVRKFFCLNQECRQRIFCERLPELAALYAHQTLRFNELITPVLRQNFILRQDASPWPQLTSTNNVRPQFLSY